MYHNGMLHHLGVTQRRAAPAADALRSLDPARVDAWRLRRSWLVERAPATKLLDVVADVVGVQAQVMSAGSPVEVEFAAG